jgi:hypothetical protein
VKADLDAKQWRFPYAYALAGPIRARACVGQPRDNGPTGSSIVDRFDALALTILKQALAEGRSYAEAFGLAKTQILANRRLANTQDGYWVIDPTDRWLGQVQCERLPWSGGEILLATDGFMRIVDVYSIAEDDTGRMESSAASDRSRRPIQNADPFRA